MKIILLCAFQLIMMCNYGKANINLLPKPRKVEYGKAFFNLQNAVVFIKNDNKSKEDLFVADYLIENINFNQNTNIKLTDRGEKNTIILTRTKPDIPLAMPGEKVGENCRESYILRVSADKIELSSPSSAGLFYGIQTLIQLADNGKIPQVDILDWPGLEYRGVMVDISHGPLPTEEEIKYYIEFLARWKTNQLYLYSEASIEMNGYPLVNRGGRLSKDEVRRIVSFGKMHHVDVIPNLDLYGHMHDLLRIEKYSGLGWSPHSNELDQVNPAQKKLLDDWITQTAELFPSPFVHVGLEEVFEVESAVAKNPGKTTGMRFKDQLNYIADGFRKFGKITMAYSDNLVLPEVINNLPSDLISVTWDYSAEFNIQDSETMKALYSLSERGVSHFIQTAVSNWYHIAIDYDRSLSNVDNLIIEGRKSGAIGLIQSVWADCSQSLVRVAFPAMAYGMIAAWQTQPIQKENFFVDYAMLMYPEEIAREVAAALEAMKQSEETLMKCIGSRTIHEGWADPFAETSKTKNARLHYDDLRNSRLFAEDALEHLYNALDFGAENKTLASLIVSSKHLDYAAYKWMVSCEVEDLWNSLGPHPTPEKMESDFKQRIASPCHSLFIDLMEMITDLKEDYRKEWLVEYTPYRLEVESGRYDAEYEYWRKAHEKLRSFISEFDYADSALPSFKSVIK